MIWRIWDVEFTDEFGDWWGELAREARAAVDAKVRLLSERGPTPGTPHSSDVRGARIRQLRELRVQAAGRPLRVFYAFDPRRSVILLIGGDKTGDRRFYERLIPLAERLYAVYLAELKREGLI